MKRKKKSESSTYLAIAVVAVLLILLIPLALSPRNSKDAKAARISGALDKHAEAVLKDDVDSQSAISSNNGNGSLIAGNVPGQPANLQSILKNGRTSYVYFHSDGCDSCMQMQSCVRIAASKRKDLDFIKIDIDRPSGEREQEIDFHSPVAEQFGIDVVPSFKLYDGKRLIAAGKEAKAMFKTIYNEVHQAMSSREIKH